MKNTFQKIIFTAVAAVGLSTVAFAQSTTDVAKQTTAVRVIDNKGAIKYFQSSNGITQIINTTANVTTTTWQLGGTLTDNTYIDSTGKVFALDGIALETGTSSTNAVSLEKTKPGGPAIVGTGWTLLVRDEATGETRKMLATNLIQSGQEIFTAAATPLLAYPLTGSPTLPNFKNVYVYRNGAKLLAGVDYTIAASTVTLVPNTAVATPDENWTLFANDKVEVHYIK